MKACLFLYLALTLSRSHSLSSAQKQNETHQVTKKEVFEGGDPHLPYGLASMQVKKKREEKKKNTQSDFDRTFLRHPFRYSLLLLRSTAASGRAPSLRQERKERRRENESVAKRTAKENVFRFSSSPSSNLASFLDPDLVSLALSLFLLPLPKTFQGWRRTMEDAHLADVSSSGPEGVFGVFDGHGGR